MAEAGKGLEDSTVRIYRRYDLLNGPAYPSSFERLFTHIREQGSALLLASAMASDDPYWRGWTDNYIQHTYPFERPRKIDLFDDWFDQEIVRVTFASPAEIESRWQIPTSLVGGVKKLISGLAHLAYYPEEKEKRRLANQLAREEIFAAQVDNLERVLNLGDRLGNTGVVDEIYADVASSLTGISREHFGSRVIQIELGQFHLVDAKVTDEDPNE